MIHHNREWVCLIPLVFELKHNIPGFIDRIVFIMLYGFESNRDGLSKMNPKTEQPIKELYKLKSHHGQES